MNGFLVLETGESFEGNFLGSKTSAEFTADTPVGEVVFNTSHSGYEEMATDPSYFNQILVTTAPMQGNYGIDDSFWESKQIWIKGFVCLEIQKSKRDSTWLRRLNDNNIPVLEELDTRSLVFQLREAGTTWGAMILAKNAEEAKGKAFKLIQEKKKVQKDWPFLVTTKEVYDLKGSEKNGLKIAVLDFGAKQNIMRELMLRVEHLRVFPSRTSVEEIKKWNPHGIMLSNGPGDPEEVLEATENIKDLIGWKPIFGICMGHQILARALGGHTYKLKFGHRGSNHPIKDLILNKIYMTSQNHGYAVDPKSLPSSVDITHFNLNDGTVAGIRDSKNKCFSVQFHPESRPGPHDAAILFDEFIKQVR
ncbi:MAG: glutamine-hydrolyzing carbamoyl-phosphate synthase small subunit [Bdellovibrionaceae bacterium]|nr:glutamine-hydrolyzing carbamoyl-phosphate synthase small subunit [Pseudobdellovibrionaceae bacterium]